MLKRLFKLIAIVCLIVFVPYLIFLGVNQIYPEFIFIFKGDDYYQIIFMNWLLGILVGSTVIGIFLIMKMIYLYIRYGV